MFRSFIYLDEDKLYTFKRQIEGVNSVQPKTVNNKKEVGMSANFNGLGIKSNAETSITGDYEKDVSFDYDKLEAYLQELEAEDYFDFVLYQENYDIHTVSSMKIIRLNTNFEIPEQFDMVELIGRFKHILMKQVATNTLSEQQMLEKVFENASTDIPIIAEYEDVIISSKLNAKKLKEDYENLEDYADQEVYMLCKVVGIVKKDTVEIFDPLKDFIKLPRNLRREMYKQGNDIGLEKISVNGPVLKVEVIAIYK